MGKFVNLNGLENNNIFWRFFLSSNFRDENLNKSRISDCFFQLSIICREIRKMKQCILGFIEIFLLSASNIYKSGYSTIIL